MGNWKPANCTCTPYQPNDANCPEHGTNAPRRKAPTTTKYSGACPSCSRKLTINLPELPKGLAFDQIPSFEVVCETCDEKGEDSTFTLDEDE